MNADKIFIKSFRPYLWIALIGFLLYSPSLFFELTYLDDNVWLVDYGWYLQDAAHIKEIFLRPDLISQVFYRPVLGLSFLIDAQFYGGSLLGYHLSNILFHVCGSMLVFVLFFRLGYERARSFLSALVFCVHPVLTSAVAWIPGRTDSLLGVFILSSFLFFQKSLEERGVSFLIGHLFFFLCALLTKETAVILPVICGLYYFMVSGSEKKLREAASFLFCWVIVTGLWAWGRGAVIAPRHQVPWEMIIQSIRQNAPAMINYLGKAAFPFRLSVLPVLEDLFWVEGIAGIIILVVLAFSSRQKRWPHALFASLWFILFLTPALIISFLKHEYRLYLPLVGFLLFFLEITRGRDIRFLNAFVAGVIILFAFLTWNHSRHYKDRFAFWENAVATSAQAPLAHRNLGAMYQLEGKVALAKESYRKALALNPYEGMVHNNLGVIAVSEGDLSKAEEEYLEEIKINPDYANTYYNLGFLYYRQGTYRKAEAMWEKAINLNPDYIEAYNKLIFYYVTQNDYKRADYYRRILSAKGIELPERMRPFFDTGHR